jgi:iron complex transport system substrate-binding protein
MRYVLSIVATCLALAGCGAPRDTTTTASGAAPARIISCAPNLTEMLFALGAGPRVIGVTRFCQFPPEARDRPPLGDLYQPNLEAIVAARPDLIVLVPGNRKVLDFFAGKAEPTILETNACETIAEIQATIRRLGAAVGAPARGDSLVAAIDAGLEAVRAAHAGVAPVRYLLILGHAEGALEQIYVVGPPTYLGELMEMVGGVNVVDAALGRYPIVTREAIVAMNPDVVLERHLGGTATDEQKARTVALWNQLPTLSAVRNGRVRVLDDDHVTINGPDLVNTAWTLSAALHDSLVTRP